MFYKLCRDVGIVFRFWFFKIIAIVGICIGVFFIEGDSASKFALGMIFVYFVLFILFYLLSLWQYNTNYVLLFTNVFACFLLFYVQNS